MEKDEPHRTVEEQIVFLQACVDVLISNMQNLHTQIEKLEKKIADEKTLPFVTTDLYYIDRGPMCYAIDCKDKPIVTQNITLDSVNE